MKHPSTRELYEYWDKQRAGAAAPDRNAIEPGPIRHLLGDTLRDLLRPGPRVFPCASPARGFARWSAGT